MPVDIFSIDQLYPTFTVEETNTEKIERLADYLYKLIESLRYTLYHLGEENFSGGFDELKKKIEADIGTQIDQSDYVKQKTAYGGSRRIRHRLRRGNSRLGQGDGYGA